MATHPFDPTATLPGNRIVDSRNITTISGTQGTGYLVVPELMPFYAQGFVLVDEAGNFLEEGADFEFARPWTQASEQIGRPVYGGFILTNPNFTGRINFTMQIVGGDWCDDHAWATNINEGINSLDSQVTLDLSTIPQNLPPTPHSHPLDELDGMNQIYDKFNEIVAAIQALPFRFSAQDLDGFDTALLNPMLSAIGDMTASVAVGGQFTIALNDLLTKMNRLHPWAAAADVSALSHVTIPVGGFLKIKVGKYTGIVNPDTLPEVNFPVPFTAAVFGGQCWLTYSDAAETDTSAFKNTIHTSTPALSGVESLVLTRENPTFVPDAGQAYTLHYIYIGV